MVHPLILFFFSVGCIMTAHGSVPNVDLIAWLVCVRWKRFDSLDCISFLSSLPTLRRIWTSNRTFPEISGFKTGLMCWEVCNNSNSSVDHQQKCLCCFWYFTLCGRVSVWWPLFWFSSVFLSVQYHAHIGSCCAQVHHLVCI